MGIDSNDVIETVKTQLQLWKTEKFGWKRIALGCLRRLFRNIFNLRLRLFSKSERSNPGVDDLGVDEFGRDIKEKLLRYIEILKSRGIKLHTLIVMGSRAKRRWKPESDVDVTVIATGLPSRSVCGFPSFPQKILQIRRRILLSDIPLMIGIEAKGCSKEEFLQWLNRFRLMPLDAMYYGKIVYDDGFWIQVKKRFNEIRKEYNLREMRLKQLLLPL